MADKPKNKQVAPATGNIFQRFWEQMRLSWALLQDNRVSMALKLIPIVALVFLLSPFDLVLNLIPVLGQIDDVAVVVIAVALFNGLAPAEIVDEHLLRLRSRNPYRVHHDKDGVIIDVKSEVVQPADDEPQASSDDDFSDNDHVETHSTSHSGSWRQS